MGPQSLRPLLSILLFSLTISSTSAMGQANDHRTPATSAYVYVGTCPGYCNNGGSQISGFAVAADGSAQPIPGSPFSMASYELSANSNFLFAVGGSAYQNIFTYAAGSDGSLAQAGVVNGVVPGGCGGDQYVDSLSPEPTGHFLDVGEGVNSCGTFYRSWSISPTGQLSYVGDPNPYGAYAWGWTLAFSSNGQFAYTGTAAEYDGSLAGFRRDEHGNLTRFNPNPASPPGPGPGDGFCYASNAASSSTGYVAVLWWAGLYCENLPVVGIANYAIDSDGTLALVPGSEIVTSINLHSMLYDPSGQYLAIVGSIGTWPDYQGVIQIYKLQRGGGLVAAGPAQYVPGVGSMNYVAWDSPGHLYAVGGDCSAACGLYIFNNDNGVLTPAPGSPHAVANIVSLAVLPAR